MTDSIDVQPSSQVLFQELEGESVLLNLQTERYYGLDNIGTRFWQLLTAQGSADAAVKQMLNEFAVDEATLRADLVQLVTELTAAGLVTPSAGLTAPSE